MVVPYATAETRITVAGTNLSLKTLADRQQFHDPDGEFESAGVPPAFWSLFGVTWEAGLMLAELAATLDVGDRRMLEIGAGLGVPSMILKKRGADITASDVHPLGAEFFAQNLQRNGISQSPYLTLDWREPSETLGRFDLIIASDVLYEAAHVTPLAGFVERFCNDEFILTDPGRGQVNAFTRRLEAAGFKADVERRGKARVARYVRST